MKEIKRLLLKEKAAILSDIREKTESDGDNKTEIGDAIDSSVEEQERELDLLLQDREQARLEGIEIALTRIESDDFGYCDECGEEISKKDFLLFHWPERASIASQILNAADSHKMRFPVQTIPARF